MIQKYKINFDLNQLISDVKLKKKYLNSLKSKSLSLTKIRGKYYKSLSYNLFNHSSISKLSNYFLVTYVISISFSRSNTFLHVTDFFGKLIFFYSAGSFKHTGKNKKARFIVFKDMYQKLVSKLSFLKNKPVALHLQNVGSNKIWIIKKLETKFFITCVKVFNNYPHNGCRKRKARRKKFKKRKRRSG